MALALLPILFLLLLLVGARWSAAWAGLATALFAATIAILGFGYGRSGEDWLGPIAEAAFLSLTILWIIFGALCIHEYQSRSGAISLLGRWLGSFGDDRRVTALFVAWFFALFLEGAAGFGTPVALAAPLLVGLGFSPARALTLVLIGHAAGVSFGAVGTPVVPLLAAAAVSAAGLSLAVALVHAVLGWTLAAHLFRMARPRRAPAAHQEGGGWWIAAAAACFFFPYCLLAGFAGPELPTLGGALAGAIGFAAFARSRLRSGAAAAGNAVPAPAIAGSALPYLLVVLIILFTRLVPPVREALSAITVEWSLGDRFSGAAAPLYHPGTVLILAFLATGLVRKGSVGAAVKGAAARLPPVALALVAVLTLARLMVHSGMIAVLAEAASGLLGGAWLVAAPFVGALGAFITGSATASNILFAELQVGTAASAGVAPALALAGQGVGSGIGNIIAPHNIVAGAATVGLIGGEWKVLKRTLPVCLAYAAAAGVLLFVAAMLSPFSPPA